MELEELQKKFDELPENIQEALLSSETANSIYETGKSANLTDEKISLLAELVGNLFMEPSKNSDLTDEIKNGLGVSDDDAKAMSVKIGGIVRYIESRPMKQTTEDEEAEEELEDVKKGGEENAKLKQVSDIFPIKPVFVKDESLEFIRTTKPPEPPTPSVNSTPLPLSPPSVTNQTQISHPQEASTFEPQHGAPFILHNEEEIEPAKESFFQSVSERPIFYKPTFSEEYKKSVLEKEAASIELGEETEKKKQPESFKTPIKEVRVVHYSEFRTPLGPFENQGIQKLNKITPEQEPQNTQSKTQDVHPNNVVDLKDLPLE